MLHRTPNQPTVNKPTLARNHAFTLIEMLVVVVIIGILAGVLVPRLMGAKERASDSARIVKVGQISSAVELYAQEQGSKYPLAVLTGAPGISIATPSVSSAIAPYMTTIPTDPGKGTVAISGAVGNIQVTGDSFAYWTNDAGTGYAITALMESKKGNTTNATGVIDSDKQGGYQVVGRGLSTNIVAGGGGGGPTNPITNYGPDIQLTYNGKTYYIKDRNVGATQTGTDGYNAAVRGYHFQWGNNYGFPSSPTYYALSRTGTVDTNSYNGNFSSDFFRYDDRDYFGYTRADWSTNQNDNLRLEKAQGPCPSGYHIPTQAERTDVIAYYGNNEAALMNSLQLSNAGYRHYTSANSVFVLGMYGRYWTSTSNNIYATSMHLGLSNPSASFSDNRAYGFSVRCFKNSY